MKFLLLLRPFFQLSLLQDQLIIVSFLLFPVLELLLHHSFSLLVTFAPVRHFDGLGDVLIELADLNPALFDLADQSCLCLLSPTL